MRIGSILLPILRYVTTLGAHRLTNALDTMAMLPHHSRHLHVRSRSERDVQERYKAFYEQLIMSSSNISVKDHYADLQPGNIA
jgi:hypothetical protein